MIISGSLGLSGLSRLFLHSYVVGKPDWLRETPSKAWTAPNWWMDYPAPFISYYDHFVTGELELEVTEPNGVEMALHYEFNKWTTGISGDAILITFRQNSASFGFIFSLRGWGRHFLASLHLGPKPNF